MFDCQYFEALFDIQFIDKQGSIVAYNIGGYHMVLQTIEI